MTAPDSSAGESDGRGSRRQPFFTRLSAARWRAAAVILAAAYLFQDASGFRWEWLARLQQGDSYRYASGVSLAAYVGWVGALFAGRPQGMALRRRTDLHQKAGALAPALLYLHSVEIGYGYAGLLSWVFLGAVLIGLASPFGLRMRSPAYHDAWVALHVLSAVLLAILILFHAYLAVYYK